VTAPWTGDQLKFSSSIGGNAESGGAIGAGVCVHRSVKTRSSENWLFWPFGKLARTRQRNCTSIATGSVSVNAVLSVVVLTTGDTKPGLSSISIS